MLAAADFVNLKFSFRWSERKQTPAECAPLAVAYLKLVQESFPGFRTWRPVDSESKKAVPITRPSLTRLFQQGQQISEKDGQPQERHGALVYLSTSAESLGFLGVYLRWGGYGRGNINVAVLDTYLHAKPARRLLTLTRCRKFCEQTVALLQPDDGVLDNLALFRQSQSPSSGWIVYLAQATANRLPKLPRGVEARPCKPWGMFLIAADHSFPHVPPDNLKTLQSLGKLVDPLVEPRH